MQHIMLDAYNTQNNELLNDLKYTYDSMVKICKKLNLKQVMPPVLVPYYYGQVIEDDGISAYVLLKGGHFTIHSFPQRSCYFVDIFSQEYVSDENFARALYMYFPYDTTQGKINTVDRRLDVENQLITKNIIDSDNDFGPHYLMETTEPVDLNIDKIYHILDELPSKINMDLIMRPFVLTDKIKNYEFVSGIAIIAQSHVAIHYNVKEKQAYIDIFSCSFLKGDNFASELERTLGVKLKSNLISRGSKHKSQISLREDIFDLYKKWEENISE